MILLSRMHLPAFLTVNVDRWSCNIVAKKDPFPNEWQAVFNLDDDQIEQAPFIEVFEDTSVWDLPDPYCCIVRSYNRSDNKLREYAYKREGVAQLKIKELAIQGLEVTLLTQNFVATINYPDED